MPGPMQGLARGLAQQGQNPWQMPVRPGGAQPWGAQATAQLQGLSQKLGGQAWGDPGQGAPTIQNPGANRRVNPQGVGPQADSFRAAAQQYAAAQRPEAEDPRMRGMIR